MGKVTVTIQNLDVVRVDMDKNVILVKGSVPGAKKSLVLIKTAVKTDKKNEAFDLISYEEIKEETVVNEEALEDNSNETSATEE